MRMRSTSSKLISLLRRSWSLVVRVEAWLVSIAAFSSVPPFFRYAVMLVARKVRLPIVSNSASRPGQRLTLP